MMYLADTHIFLEILLSQEKRGCCEKFLSENIGKIGLSDFSFHSIGLICSEKKPLVEYLTLFSQTWQVPRYAVAGWVKDYLGLKGEVRKKSDSDAGTLQFQDVDPLELWRMRYALGEMISKKAPPYKRALVTVESMPFDERMLPDPGYVTPAPAVPSLRPECDRFGPN